MKTSWCENPFSHLLPRESFPASRTREYVHPMARYRADEHLPYFCTISVLDWLPVLIEARAIDPIVESLRFCRQHKGLELFAFVVMPNHVHLITAASGRRGARRDSRTSNKDSRTSNKDSRTSELGAASDPLHTVMRDFKRFTSRAIHDRLKQDGRITSLGWLETATQRARRQHGELGLWQDGFHPQALFSRDVFEQKLNYLHENPVRKGLVRRPDDWWYSSAAFYSGRKDVCMEVDLLES